MPDNEVSPEEEYLRREAAKRLIAKLGKEPIEPTSGTPEVTPVAGSKEWMLLSGTTASPTIIFKQEQITKVEMPPAQPPAKQLEATGWTAHPAIRRLKSYGIIPLVLYMVAISTGHLKTWTEFLFVSGAWLLTILVVSLTERHKQET